MPAHQLNPISGCLTGSHLKAEPYQVWGVILGSILIGRWARASLGQRAGFTVVFKWLYGAAGLRWSALFQGLFDLCEMAVHGVFGAFWIALFNRIDNFTVLAT